MFHITLFICIKLNLKQHQQLIKKTRSVNLPISFVQMYPYPTAVNQHLREVCLNTEFQSTALYWKDISTNSEQNSRNCNDFEKSFGT